MLEWFQNPIFSIAFAIGLMFFGYFFGLFEGRAQGYKRGKAEESEAKETAPEAEPLPPASPSLPPDETSILNLGEDETGNLRLKLDGQQTDTSDLDAGQRKRLIEIITLMRPWLEVKKPASPPQAVSPSRSTFDARDERRPARGPNGDVPTPSQPQPASSPQATPASPPATRGERKTAPPIPNEEDKDEEPAPEPQSIVAQIDSVLQARLVGTPLAGKGVRLQESLEGGVLVWVGLEKYEGIEAVPDEQVKVALKGAVAEWENKFTPGG